MITFHNLKNQNGSSPTIFEIWEALSLGQSSRWKLVVLNFSEGLSMGETGHLQRLDTSWICVGELLAGDIAGKYYLLSFLCVTRAVGRSEGGQRDSLLYPALSPPLGALYCSSGSAPTEVRERMKAE